MRTNKAELVLHFFRSSIFSQPLCSPGQDETMGIEMKGKKDAGLRSIEISILDAMKEQAVYRISKQYDGDNKMFKMREIVGKQWSCRPTHCNLFDTPTLQSAYKPTTPTVVSVLGRCFSCQNDLHTQLAWPSS